MTDYAEEQRNELEALESIYPDEFEQISNTEFRIRVEPEEQDPAEPCILGLHVIYTPTYPDEMPIIEIEQETESMEQMYHEKLMAEVTRVAEESIGMAMIFTLASLLKDNLTQMIVDRRTAREEADAERVRRDLEAEEARFRGTRVSSQLFLEWKAGFDKEMAEKEAAERGKIKDIKGKLTGRQLFETDKSLVQSDVNLIEEGDIAVDMSLFEREEGIESDASDEDDENAVWKNFGDDD